jgi:hypothetical protein
MFYLTKMRLYIGFNLFTNFTLTNILRSDEIKMWQGDEI